MTEVDPDVIKKTQSSLGKYVKKPVLTDKLLNKPPFRFLHDIITSVIQNTGYLEGLFEPEEMVSANVKDKDAKISFLQKVIDTVRISTKENVNVKPSKIVAGQEPERTNELLQLIGVALSRKISSTEAVKMVRNKDIPKPSKNSSTKSSKVLKQSSVDSVKTKSKSVDDSKALKDNNKLVPRVRESKDKINDKPIKDRKERETKVGRDGKKPARETKEAKGSDRVRSEKVKTKNDVDLTKSSAKIVKDNAEEKVDIDLNSKVDSTTNGYFQSNSDDKDVMGEEVIKKIDGDDLQKSFEPEIVSVQIQAGLSKSKNEENADRGDGDVLINGDELEKRKSVRTSDKKVEKLRSEEIDDSPSQAKQNKPESLQPITSNGDNSLEQNESPQTLDKETKEPKPSGESKKETEDSIEITNTAIELRKNSVVTNEMPSMPRPRTSLRPPSVRPASARPGAPRRRDKNVEIILQPDGNLPKPAVNIKIDALNVELDDDGENLVIIEDSSNESNDLKFGVDTSHENIDEQQGHLVQQILETQKEFLKIGEEASEKRRTESEWEPANSHQRQTSAKQMDSLRDSIQKLTRSINPLGKLMDFLQEDVDSMQMELSMWKTSYENTKQELRREEGLNESAIEPLKLQLAQIESDIKDQIEIMDLARVDIMENEEKVMKLLTEM
ncbi:TRAF3-interacting protein 1 [Pseudolycoriella hygida]|uniref:TRAF3-interacting protein 1 n=1 Tax=Pseudolycoriella hygida TaxID=35572 RepID=A0A9Q0MSB5_9DIPT|nr:TRAF3-interacting protein 1 [Pseudolycoriella hygida]